jgi:hypothetical protein
MTKYCTRHIEIKLELTDLVISILHSMKYAEFRNPGGLDLSRRDLDRDLDLDAKKVSVSTVEKISTVFKS